MDNKDKAINILSSGVIMRARILYYICIIIMIIILSYNIYALINNLKNYLNNYKYIQNINATIEKLNKEKNGSVITKNTNNSSTSEDKYHYNLTLSFMINNEKITIDKEEITTNIYNVGDIMNITYNINLKQIDENYKSFIIINIVLIIIISIILFFYFKYPDEIKGLLFFNSIIK